MKRAIAIGLLSFALCACSDAPTARRTLEASGFRNVEITGWRLFGCGQDDQFHTGFRAIGPTGVVVTGVVCGGWFKGATIRID